MIARLQATAIETFDRHRQTIDTPVILEGVMDDWPATRIWDFEYFRRRWGGVEVAACTEANGEHRFDRSQQSRMPLSRLLDHMEGTEGNTRKYFLSQCRVEGEIADLAADVPLPAPLAIGGIELLALWIAAEGAVTHLHWDSHPGLLALLRGHKAVSLFSPMQFDRLYPVPISETKLNWSEVDIFELDQQRFPTFATADRIDIELRAGEILYIPQYWWHSVRNVKNSVGIQYVLSPYEARQNWRNFYWQRQALHRQRAAELVA